MCTSISYYTDNSKLFGRNLDLEYSFGEHVVITPRNYDFNFKFNSCDEHYALMGIAFANDGYPLYFDAMNEHGLGMAGLNFPGNANYRSEDDGIFYAFQVASYEFIPWILRQCKTVEDVKSLLVGTIITDKSFNKKLPPTPLHWMVSDEKNSIVIEQGHGGIRTYDNPVGVLTNNPTFDRQLFNLNNYMSLSCDPPKRKFSPKLDFDEYSRGMGAIGLPGDLSSMSRFVRASFVKMNSVSDDGEEESVSQFFHILKSVEQQRGCVRLDGKYEITQYTSCYNLIYNKMYYTTYDNSQINAVSMDRENLDGSSIIQIPMMREMNFNYQN